VATSRVYLKGGPCDGKTVSANQIVGGLVAYIACGGGYYELDSGQTRPNGDPIFAYSGKTKPQPPSGGGPQNINAPKALHGWKSLRKSVNKSWPKALNYMEHGNNAALRSLGRSPKVKL
jgi:hypothetical protein